MPVSSAHANKVLMVSRHQPRGHMHARSAEILLGPVKACSSSRPHQMRLNSTAVATRRCAAAASSRALLADRYLQEVGCKVQGDVVRRQSGMRQACAVSLLLPVHSLALG